VTAVLFLRGGGVLATGGTGDACVKLWDARNLAEPMVRDATRGARAILDGVASSSAWRMAHGLR
jgi:hypothetical protein